jgi:hypothetical protein
VSRQYYFARKLPSGRSRLYWCVMCGEEIVCFSERLIEIRRLTRQLERMNERPL